MLPYFFCENISVETPELSQDTSKHIVQVLRMKAGDHILLTDGAGNSAKAELIEVSKKSCSVLIIDRFQNVAPQRRTTIAVSLTKNSSRFEWLLEKCTEIGVNEIIPLICERTEKQHFRFERANGILVSAMLQSRNVWKPQLHLPKKFRDCIQSLNHDIRLIAHCNETVRKDISTIQPAQTNVILIGPEGDFTDAEIEIAKNFIPVKLGDTRLRTETAAMVAATFLCIS